MAKYGNRKGLFIALALLAAALAAGYGWVKLHGNTLPADLASGNGRIEATEVDIATKIPGHLTEVMVKEGDLVSANQVLARMDPQELQAQLRQAQALVQQAREDARQTEAQVLQAEQAARRIQAQVRQAQEAARRAQATVSQRDSELALSRQTLARSVELAAKGFVSSQKLDQDRATLQSAEAALQSARAGATEAEAAIAATQAQQTEAEAGIAAARARVTSAQQAVAVAQARVEQMQVNLDENTLRTPIAGRVLYRLVEPGAVLAAGGKVLTVLDLTDVYMTIFLPTEQAGRVTVGSDARIVLDAAPQYVIPAKVSFVAPRSQFTPREVETRTEREKLMFRVKVRIAPALLQRFLERVKTGLPGVAYVPLSPEAQWPERLQVKLPQ
nr:HlyD family efflux transporter periplasmic adaptor subunit [uncultured Pseudogulbenkiania sp.]